MDNYEDIVGGEAEELDEVGHFKYTSKRGYGDRKVGTYLGKYPNVAPSFVLYAYNSSLNISCSPICANCGQ